MGPTEHHIPWEPREGERLAAEDSRAVNRLSNALVLLQDVDGEARAREVLGGVQSRRPAADDENVRYRVPINHTLPFPAHTLRIAFVPYFRATRPTRTR